MIDPAACQTMRDVRAGVDALDAQIVALIGRRMRFMDAAARIKPERGMVRDEARKRVVIDHARAMAEREGAPPDLIAALYEILVEGSIAYELTRFDATRG